MAIMCQPENFEHAGKSGKPFFASPDAGLVLQNVATGATLYQAGDRRTLYRIESGALCHYMLWSDGRHDVIEFAFPGDIVGLGHLNHHVSTAQAMVDTVVSLVSEEEFAAICDRDDRLSFRLASAVEREFEHLRDKSLSGPGHIPAAARVANFLLALSANNKPEGRDPSLISDDITAGFVAEQLNMSIEKLGAALLLLKKEGAVSETPSGLRIMDAATLQKVADAA